MFSKKKQSEPPVADLNASIAAANRMSVDNNRVLAMLAQDYLKERKARRRWGLAIKLLIVAYLAVVTFLYFKPADGLFPKTHTALVEINGIIASQAESSQRINESLRRAFSAEAASGVILRINSPGGSPVQSAEINAEIQRLKRKNPNKPFYVVISEICASGGYYVAVAADQIYGNPSSLVGSIGVRMDGFGFVESMQKLGVERRLLTAGENKAMLDPFLPVNESQQRHAKRILQQIHQQFIDTVKQGRGERLTADANVFSGLFWSGEQARTLGLIDSFGSVDDVARDVIGAEDIVNYTFSASLLDRFARQVGASISNSLLQSQLNLL